jgi:GalNAc-alpha-(1->4)-GalNAc-alpha-(1->3)-diNAcBac-PP-undecaprenol alpha-1,4-N-acetyl-D-galactosaminyltransferase
MKITLTITQLEGGGAERVMVLLAQGLSQRGHDVTVITISSDANDFYVLPSTIQRIALDLNKQSHTLMKRILNGIILLSRLRQAIRTSQPDVVISFMADMNIFTVLALMNTNYPVIGTQHCNPKFLPVRQPWESFRRFTYRRLQTLVSVSEGVDNEFNWLPKAQRTVIYNPFLPVQAFSGQLDYPRGTNPDKKWIVAMGRLTYAKGFDLLLLAFQKIVDRHPNWQLLILGEGELRQELEALIERLDLSESVVLTGKIRDPFSLLQHSELFVLSSRTEGFPMALGEALACGLPVIATNCSQGVRELMRDGIDGKIVPEQNVEALATAMSELMVDELQRHKFASRAPEVVERFSLDKFLDQWEKLLVRVC